MSTLDKIQAIFAEHGVTDQPTRGRWSYRAYTIECVSTATRREIIAQLPEQRRAHKLEEAAAFGIDLDIHDTITVKCAAWRGDSAIPRNFAAWMKNCAEQIPAGYEPVRLIDPPNSSDDFGITDATFTAWRTLLGLSQIELAAALGVSRDTVKSWEQGRRTVNRGVTEDMLRLREEHDRDLDAAIMQAEKYQVASLGGDRPDGWWQAVGARLTDRIPDAMIQWGDNA